MRRLRDKERLQNGNAAVANGGGVGEVAAARGRRKIRIHRLVSSSSLTSSTTGAASSSTTTTTTTTSTTVPTISTTAGRRRSSTATMARGGHTVINVADTPKYRDSVLIGTPVIDLNAFNFAMLQGEGEDGEEGGLTMYYPTDADGVAHAEEEEEDDEEIEFDDEDDDDEDYNDDGGDDAANGRRRGPSVMFWRPPSQAISRNGTSNSSDGDDSRAGSLPEHDNNVVMIPPLSTSFFDSDSSFLDSTQVSYTNIPASIFASTSSMPYLFNGSTANLHPTSAITTTASTTASASASASASSSSQFLSAPAAKRYVIYGQPLTPAAATGASDSCNSGGGDGGDGGGGGRFEDGDDELGQMLCQPTSTTNTSTNVAKQRQFILQPHAQANSTTSEQQQQQWQKSGSQSVSIDPQTLADIVIPPMIMYDDADDDDNNTQRDDTSWNPKH